MANEYLNAKVAGIERDYAALSKVNENLGNVRLSFMNIDSWFFFRIHEIGNCWEENEENISEILTALFTGLHSVKIPFSMVVKSDGNSVEVYFGATAIIADENGQHKYGNNNDEILKGLLKGCLPGIKLSDSSYTFEALSEYEDAIFDNTDALKYGGFIKGNPSKKESGSPIDQIINGMHGKRWAFIITGYPESKRDTVNRHTLVMEKASEASEFVDVSVSSNNTIQNSTSNKKNFSAERYCEIMQDFSKMYADAMNVGEWLVTLQYAAVCEGDADLLSGLIVSSFYGEDSKPEPTSRIKRDVYCPLVDVISNYNSAIIASGFNYPEISTRLSSSGLAVYASLPTVDTAGFSVKSYVEFDVSREKSGPLAFGKIIKNGSETENLYSLDYNELNRHCLVVGLTGSGKTNTTKNILYNIRKGSKGRVPIMVIEPAKKEYWELYKLGFSDLQIYSVGSSDPRACPYCLNPFERIGNISLQTHIDNVFAAFKASFILYTPMPYILERAIYEIYEDYGWDIRTGSNTKGTDLYPTIEDLYLKIPNVVIDMGYDQKMKNDLIGSLQARVNSLRLGSKGDTLNVRKSFPIEKILSSNVVIELEDIGDDDVKAFIISMLLIQLVEYRRQQKDSQLEIKHILLIEEAHRLLKNVRSGTGENADPRGAAVEFFCNLLAELRSKGQGFLIADQIPSKLAPDLIKNTNIKIVHRTVDREDRELMGGAMHMTEEQTDYLSSLGRGIAAIYSEGDNRPKLMKPPYAGDLAVSSVYNISNEFDVLAMTRQNCYTSKGSEEHRFNYQSLTNDRHACRACKPYCTKRPESIFKRIDEKLFRQRIESRSFNVNGVIKMNLLRDVFNEILDKASITDKNERIEARYCMFCLTLEILNFSDNDKKNLIKSYFAR